MRRPGEDFARDVRVARASVALSQVIGAHDLWIAATALAHGLGVATGNVADLERVPGLRVVGTHPG